jgi:hypothetical protein
MLGSGGGVSGSSVGGWGGGVAWVGWGGSMGGGLLPPE